MYQCLDETIYISRFYDIQYICNLSKFIVVILVLSSKLTNIMVYIIVIQPFYIVR